MIDRKKEAVTGAEALERQGRGALIIDVRDDDEYADPSAAPIAPLAERQPYSSPSK